MPSTLVHVSLAALLACSLLGRSFSVRALAVVLASVAALDLDVFVGFVVLGAHRAAFHTLLWPALGALALAVDARRDDPWLAGRFGAGAYRVGWVVVAAVTLAGIGPDLATNGANLLYPVHDQFYVLDGQVRLSDRRGVVQSFVEFSNPESAAKGSTEEVQYYTGADPEPSNPGADTGGEGPPPERVFPVVGSGLQALLVVTAGVVTAARLRFEDCGDVAGGDRGTGTAGEER